ncbi:MAG: hypothetical protein ACO3FE_04405 [Planctomycetaceae bacterium]
MNTSHCAELSDASLIDSGSDQCRDETAVPADRKRRITSGEISSHANENTQTQGKPRNRHRRGL